MAQRITTLFIDDIDGDEAVGTVRFALDGTDYEIDLNSQNSDDLRNILRKYAALGRKVGGAARRTGRSGRGSRSTLSSAEVRNWARMHNVEVKDRGRVPADIVEQYQAATGK